jgi:hypothetical protein
MSTSCATLLRPCCELRNANSKSMPFHSSTAMAGRSVHHTPHPSARSTASLSREEVLSGRPCARQRHRGRRRRPMPPTPSTSTYGYASRWPGCCEPPIQTRCSSRREHKPQRDTTRHDTTRHDTTRHDTTRHDTTRHDTTRHDTTRHDTTRHDTTHCQYTTT